jgi:hypothetical protein
MIPQNNKAFSASHHLLYFVLAFTASVFHGQKTATVTKRMNPQKIKRRFVIIKDLPPVRNDYLTTESSSFHWTINPSSRMFKIALGGCIWIFDFIIDLPAFASLVSVKPV